MIDVLKNTPANASTGVTVGAGFAGSDGTAFDINAYAGEADDPRPVEPTSQKSSDRAEMGQGWDAPRDDELDAADYDDPQLAMAAEAPAEAAQTQADGAESAGDPGQAASESAPQTGTAKGQAAEGLLTGLTPGETSQGAPAAQSAETQSAAMAAAARNGQAAGPEGTADAEAATRTTSDADLELDGAAVSAGARADADADGEDAADDPAGRASRDAAAEAESRNVRTAAQSAVPIDAAAGEVDAEATPQPAAGPSALRGGQDHRAAASMGEAQDAPAPVMPETPAAQPTDTVATTMAGDGATTARIETTAARATASAAAAQADNAQGAQASEPDIDRLAERTVQWRSLGLLGNGGSARIRLSPPDMGTVEVSLRTDGQTVQVSMMVESESVRQALQNNSGRLAESLQAHGLQSGRIEVTVATPQDARGDADGQGGGRQQAFSGNGDGSDDGGQDRNGGQSSESDRRDGYASTRQHQQEEMDIPA